MTPIEQQLTPPGGWHVPAGLRIEPLPRSELKLWEQALVWALLKFKAPKSANTELPLLFSVLMRHRRLFYPWLRFASRLMPNGTLDRRDAELAILRVGWNCRCRYEWGQHVEIGLRAGLRPEQIARVARGAQASGWETTQQALLLAVDELHRDHRISATTWRRLAEHYEDRQLIELTMLIGHYVMLAGVLNSLEMTLEVSVEEALGRADIHRP